MDSTTAIDVILRGPSLFDIALGIFIFTGIYCKIKDLIFGDE